MFEFLALALLALCLFGVLGWCVWVVRSPRDLFYLCLAALLFGGSCVVASFWIEPLFPIPQNTVFPELGYADSMDAPSAGFPLAQWAGANETFFRRREARLPGRGVFFPGNLLVNLCIYTVPALVLGGGGWWVGLRLSAVRTGPAEVATAR